MIVNTEKINDIPIKDQLNTLFENVCFIKCVKNLILDIICKLGLIIEL
jgi:hypothetical protein